MKYLLKMEEEPMAFCRLPGETEIPKWAGGNVVCAVKTEQGISLLCNASVVPAATQCDRPWILLKLQSVIEYTGGNILAEILHELAKEDIQTLVFSSYETDYFLVKQSDMEQAKKLLKEAGCMIMR